MEYKYEGNSLKSGIYKITNKLNGRIYVGSAKEFKRRWSQHTSSLRNQKHSNKFLQADFNKCGEEAFVFEVIEVTEGKTKEERLFIEEGHIKQHYDSGVACYNLCDRAISREGNKNKNQTNRTEEAERERRKNIGEASKKMWAEFTPTQREHMSLAQRKKADDFWHTSKSDEAKKRASIRGKINGPISYKKSLERDPNYHEELQKRACWMEYTFISPEGVHVTFKNLRKFCHDNGFSHRKFTYIIDKCSGTAYGWTYVNKRKVSYNDFV
jgi:group I intron endonuclease